MTEISSMRAEVIEQFINIEWLINAIICQHYIGHPHKEFTLEFLYDEYCSFALKRGVLFKIAPQLKRDIGKHLYRLNTIRNYFAHVGKEIFDASQTGKPGRIPDPRDHKKSVDFAELRDEFLTLARPVVLALANHYQAIGGTLRRVNPAGG
jgi:hypothetical protein